MTVAEWYREHGKHAVYANPQKMVPLPSNVKPMSLHVPRDGRLVEWMPKREPVSELKGKIETH